MTVEKRIIGLNARARRLVNLAVFAGFGAGVMWMVQAILLSIVVERIFLQSQELTAVTDLLTGILLAILARAGLIWSGDVLAQQAAGTLKLDLRRRLTGHLFQLGPSYTRRERSGELVSTLVEGVETLDVYFSDYLPARYLAVTVSAAVFLLVLVLDPWTTLVLLFAGPMLILILALIGGRTRELSERRFAEMSWMSAFFLDMLQGIATLKMFGRSREQTNNIREISQQFGNTTMDVLRTAFQSSLVMEWAATAATAMVALEVSLRLMNGGLPLSRALAALLLTPEFFLPLRRLALKYHAGTAGKAAAVRLFDILDTPVDLPLPTAKPVADFRSQRVNLAFEHVCYAYDGGDRPALRDFSLTMNASQRVALVGPTGAGKSTVANLLLRFIEASSGLVQINSRPLAELHPAEWRAQVGWVPQHPHFFNDTVVANLKMARPEAGEAEVIEAAQAAFADPFIQALPQGYNTVIGERGARLSGGQRQRLAIARAFLKDAPLLILDEATAYLDGESEALIREALTRLMAGRTVLVIAHRMQMAFDADLVVVMEEGRIVAQGEHQILLEQNDHYRQLVATYERGSW